MTATANYTGTDTEQEAYELSNELDEEFEFSGRIGDRMKKMVDLVGSHGPYQSMNKLAGDGGPHGSTKYGYEAIHRCRHRNLIELDEEHDLAAKNSRGAVFLTDKGRKFAQQI